MATVRPLNYRVETNQLWSRGAIFTKEKVSDVTLGRRPAIRCYIIFFSERNVRDSCYRRWYREPNTNLIKGAQTSNYF